MSCSVACHCPVPLAQCVTRWRHAHPPSRLMLTQHHYQKWRVSDLLRLRRRMGGPSPALSRICRCNRNVEFTCEGRLVGWLVDYLGTGSTPLGGSHQQGHLALCGFKFVVGFKDRAPMIENVLMVCNCFSVAISFRNNSRRISTAISIQMCPHLCLTCLQPVLLCSGRQITHSSKLAGHMPSNCHQRHCASPPANFRELQHCLCSPQLSPQLLHSPCTVSAQRLEPISLVCPRCVQGRLELQVVGDHKTTCRELLT